MRIDRDDTVAGQPVMKARELLRKGKNSIWGIALVQEVLGIEFTDAATVVSELKKLGYIEKPPHPCTGEYWTNSLKGNSLALATAAQPLSRASADRKFNEFMGRVASVRDNPYFLYKVKQVVVFGSYLGTAKQVNDIDIAIELVPKEKDSRKRQQLHQQRIEEAIRQGKEFRSALDQLFWPQLEVRQYLKSRARSISLHRIEDPILEHSVTWMAYYDEE